MIWKGPLNKLDDFRNYLKSNNILFGLKLDKYFSNMTNCLLVAVTEMNDIENLKKIIESYS